jgi:LmbE family N-acetylglucosaminyl deacetylase
MVTRRGFAKTLILIWALLAVLRCEVLRAQNADKTEPDGYTANDRPPDPRLKADILLVVAHPDDESLVTSYLAREIYDDHKRVAVVYATHGDGSINDVGPEQAAAMGNIREMEGRQAVGSLGITNVWFLTGRDTLSQNVLNSLEHWGHGACLDQLVRVVRMTRPSVILTFLPDFTTGENHGDHQAAGVLATEAFDMAGDPTVFSEQVSPPSNPDQNMNLTEGLRPWQPEKIYYFYNPTYDIFSGKGPQYSSKDISPSRHVSYGRLAAEAYAHHRTQGGEHLVRAIESNTVETSQDSYVQTVTEPVQLLLGKSLVVSAPSDDVFTGVLAAGIPFQPAPKYTATPESAPSLKIGDPWNYYHVFWQAHGIDHLANIVPVEVTVKVGGTVAIPLIIDNPLDKSVSVSLSVKTPEGWKLKPTTMAVIDPHTRYFLRVQAFAPKTPLLGWQNFAVSAESDNQTIGTIPIRVQLSAGWVAPQ